MGELLIDFFCTDIGTDLIKGQNFEKQAGGAPANVCATIAKLGGKALFNGKVGNDPFGIFLKQTLEQVHVDTSMLLLDDEHPTTLAFVSLKEDGERDFIFNRGADAYLEAHELDDERLATAKILHFGSATALLDDPFQSTYLNAMQIASKNDQFVSFDPNYRDNLWNGRENAFIDKAKKAIAYADFVKVSEEELAIISGTSNQAKNVQKLHSLGAKLIAVTFGKKGTLLSNGQHVEMIPSIQVESIDSTGAGDAFVGAMLYQLAAIDIPKDVITDFNQLKEIVAFSNKVGGIVCTKIGAIAALPTYDEVMLLK